MSESPLPFQAAIPRVSRVFFVLFKELS